VGALRVFPGRVGVDLMEFFGIKIYAEKVRKKIRQTVINYLISSLVIKKKKKHRLKITKRRNRESDLQGRGVQKGSGRDCPCGVP
jgi:hypothetical protein